MRRDACFNVAMGGSLFSISQIPFRIKTSKIMHDDPDFQEKSKILAQNLHDSFEKIKTNPTGIGIFKQLHSMRVLPKTGLAELYLESNPKTILEKYSSLVCISKGCFKAKLICRVSPSCSCFPRSNYRSRRGGWLSNFQFISAI